ncbi:MAG: hypothetical protein CMF23_09525 [Ignavibacteriae bacterium]|jgi:AcrR family transcriptional regulator|nr:hypothetical protein [Ignavibacteriota bacterium]|tara:strand:- start:395 stop:1036 length:642 start_codon:yes stop_codon:yes gene_type:complete
MDYINNSEEILSRKERERQFKRNEILKAACKIFAEKGFENSTLDEIAEASEYGKGTLYNYFQNKEDIYVALLEMIIQNYLNMLSESANKTDNIFDFLKIVTEELIKFSLNNDDAFLLLTKMRAIPNGESHLKKSKKLEEHLSNVNQIYTKYFNKSVENGEIRKIDNETILVLYRNLAFSYIYHLKYCKKLENIDIKKESQFLLDFLFNGIKNN